MPLSPVKVNTQYREISRFIPALRPNNTGCFATLQLLVQGLLKTSAGILDGLGLNMTMVLESDRKLAIVLSTFLVASSVAQTSSQISSQSDIQTTSSIASSTVSQSTSSIASVTASTASPASSQTSPQTQLALDSEGSVLSSEDICSPDYQDLIVIAIHDAIEMARVTVEDKTDHEDDPAFWKLFGSRAVGNLTSI
jgi:hypothetical protein